jgi:CMP-N-acetylneuraminic acid synthetase
LSYNNQHFAFIPAREGSVGLKHKNRLFFDQTADFIDQIPWFDKTLLSSDDISILEKAKSRKYLVHTRSNELSGPTVSIKAVIKNVISDMNLHDDTYLWLFYLPILYKNLDDFTKAKSIIESIQVESLCSFIEAKTHPYNCWKYDEKSKILHQYIPNDIFRRQDLADAWMHYHYVCVFKASFIDNLNSELLCAETYPVFLDQATVENLIEVDTPEDYKKWKRLNKQELDN